MPTQSAQELRPERLGYAVACGHAEHLATAIRVYADSNDGGYRDDAVATPDFDVGRIESEMGHSPSIGRDKKSIGAACPGLLVAFTIPVAVVAPPSVRSP
jgi:hypothetical protein